MTPVVRSLMLDLARSQLRAAIRHARPEDPARINGCDRHVRVLFAAQNADSNRSLQGFWRRQVAKYEAAAA